MLNNELQRLVIESFVAGFLSTTHVSQETKTYKKLLQNKSVLQIAKPKEIAVFTLCLCCYYETLSITGFQDSIEGVLIKLFN